MERKIVKLRVDMYSDTKFKIIDTMEDRDVIHYIWTRLLTLAGKVNLEGRLYLSKNIPYTIDTLAIEFNRSAEKIKLALKVFIDLEMVELSEDNIYKVKNFVKHQNIKVNKKVDSIDKIEIVKSIKEDDNNMPVTSQVVNNVENVNPIVEQVNNTEERKITEISYKNADAVNKTKIIDFNGDIISHCWGDENIEICEFTDEPPDGKVIASFKF